jgi:hypothetical protein
MKKKELAITVSVRLTAEEAARYSRAAEKQQLTMAGLFRQLAGLQPRARGGAMPGAGRPPRKPPTVALSSFL